MATHSSILHGKSYRQRSLAGYSPCGCKRAGHKWATKEQKKKKKKSKPIAVFPSLASFSKYFILLFTKYFWMLHFKKWVEGVKGAPALSDSLFSETLRRTVRGMYLYAHEWYSAVCSLLGPSCLFKNPHKENYWYVDLNNRIVCV